MKVNFLDTAEQDLIQIYRYIGIEKQALESAEKLINELEYKTISLLSDFPEAGRRIDDNENIRFIVVRNYSIVYKIINNRVFVMNFFRGGRNWRRV